MSHDSEKIESDLFECSEIVHFKGLKVGLKDNLKALEEWKRLLRCVILDFLSSMTSKFNSYQKPLLSLVSKVQIGFGVSELTSL